MHDPILLQLRIALARSVGLAISDVVEAVYQGDDPAFAGFVGLTALWIVVDLRGGVPDLVPYPLPLGLSMQKIPRRAPLTDFHAAAKVAKLLGEQH